MASLAMASLAAAQRGSLTADEFFNLANLHSSHGRYPEAESALNQALRICEDAGDDTMAVRAWNALGELHRMRGRFAEAEPAYTRAKVILESNRGTPSDLPAVLNNLGAVYRLTGRYSEAEKAIQSALAMWEQSGNGAPQDSRRAKQPGPTPFCGGTIRGW
jgi:tetratricopeptide (TPR) repeat protein